MVQHFAVNEAARTNIINRQKKYMSLEKVRRVIIILWFAFLPFLFSLFYKMSGPQIPLWEMSMEEILLDMDLFICAMMTLFSWLTPFVIFIAVMDRVMFLQLHKRDEVLALQDDGIMNLYLPYNRSWDGAVEEVHINYSEINKLEWYECYQMLKVYAPIHYIFYSDYRFKNIARQGELTGKDGFRLFYAYYEPFDRFLNRVEQKSGVPIEKITEKTKFKREVKINGWKTLMKKYST